MAGATVGRPVTFFGLSTCVWCKKTRALLESLDIGFDFFYVDLLDAAEREQVMAELAAYNPKRNFPTVVAGDDVVVGYDEARLRRVLAL